MNTEIRLAENKACLLQCHQILCKTISISQETFNNNNKFLISLIKPNPFGFIALMRRTSS